MFAKIRLLFLFMCTIKVSISIPHPIQNADNTTRCRFSQLPTGYLTVGKTISVPGECMQVTCLEDLTIAGLTCPTYFPSSGCSLTFVDKYKEYPDCCAQMMCQFNGFRIYKKQTTKSLSRKIKSLASHNLQLPHIIMMVIIAVQYGL